jgi:hypothetical protein
MRRICMFAGSGLLALALCGAALAHDSRGYGYPNSGWSGNATVWGNSMGQAGYAGSFSYGVRYGYAPGYVPWVAGPHGPQCHHGPPGRGHHRGWDRGYKKGWKRGRKHHGRRH